MLRYFHLLTFCIACSLFVIPQFVYAAESIPSFKSDITIHQNGAVTIRETIVYDFGIEVRHGIIREIPLVYENFEEKKFEIGFDLVSVTNQNGVAYQFQENRQGNDMSIRIGDPDGMVTGIQHYVITYVLGGVIQQFSDHDELLLDVTGHGWTVQINQPVATISFHPDVMIDPSTIKTICFTGSYGSTEQNCTHSMSSDGTSVFSTHLLLPNENMTVGVSFPSNTVTYVPLTLVEENIIEKNPIAFLYGIIAWIGIGNIVLPLIFMLIWWYTGRDPSVHAPVVRTFDPPRDTNRRTLSPMEVGALVDEKINPRDISAELIHLAIQKYVIIQEHKQKLLGFVPGDIELLRGPAFKSDPELNNLPKHQKELLHAFQLDEKEVVRLSKIRDTAHTRLESLKDELYSMLVLDGFFPENPEKRRTTFAVFSILSIFALSPLLAIVLFIISQAMGRRTVAGVIAKRQALGLRQFLVSQERQYAFQEKNKFLFEKLLPYAVVFGVAKIWAKKFEQFTDYKPDWYVGDINRIHNPVLLTRHLESNLSTVESYYTPTPVRSSSGFSSGFSGGGGGFSGGGFGGGGGSSW
ncbi:DUF2207 domain-containing protein [Candidatus Roizmanbacteria bacterium]|nr:DUF2207 domain-containing protein [Candidatus Roizmanbacteria bacterium]